MSLDDLKFRWEERINRNIEDISEQAKILDQLVPENFNKKDIGFLAIQEYFSLYTNSIAIGAEMKAYMEFFPDEKSYSLEKLEEAEQIYRFQLDEFLKVALHYARKDFESEEHSD